MSTDSAGSPARNIHQPVVPEELTSPLLPSTPGTTDYMNQSNMQLKMLEQQNEKRLMHARLEQEFMDAEAASPDGAEHLSTWRAELTGQREDVLGECQKRQQ